MDKYRVVDLLDLLKALPPKVKRYAVAGPNTFVKHFDEKSDAYTYCKYLNEKDDPICNRCTVLRSKSSAGLFICYPPNHKPLITRVGKMSCKYAVRKA